MKFATVLAALATTAMAAPFKAVERDTAASSLDISDVLKGLGGFLISGDIIKGIANADAKGIPIQDIINVLSQLNNAQMGGADE